MQTWRNTFCFNEIYFTSDILLYLLYACCNQEIEEDEEEKEVEEEAETAVNNSSDVDKDEEADKIMQTESGGLHLVQETEVSVKEFDNRVSV